MNKKSKNPQTQKEAPVSKDKKIILGILVSVLIAFGIAISLYNSNTPEEKARVRPSEQLVRPDSQSRGNPTASVILVEFLDPECESCEAFEPELKRILHDYGNKIRFVVRYMPLHGNSLLAATAAEAAALQGRYWEYKDLLFATQHQWGHQSQPQIEAMIDFAHQLGLDLDKFGEDLNSPVIREKIARDQADGVSLGVTGTPTFFVNGEQLYELSGKGLRFLLDKHLKK